MDNYRLSEQDRATLQYRVTTKLREVILRGEFEDGERLVQEEWAEKLGVSRMPIREALKQLEVEGLVRIEPRRGAIVTPISVEDIEEIYQLRALLEGEAVEKSLPNLSKEHIEDLENICEQMKDLEVNEHSVAEFMRLNENFHKILYEGCTWRRIHGLIETLWKGIPPYTPSLLTNHLDESHQEHRLMLEYVKQNESEKLKEVVQKHILRTRDNLIKYVVKSKKQES
ncbi:GntR family transcriptional regulator [Robertmurraya kyonggiensis]|uniref:GntR family transcriptional regulator n=1 Tax=Robertmurraya kyonggiensis TaxID=1037680 RepID=A0A4U1DA66_9BACI|nr:GntR family transcriptional regulator [Robertmurraya kyonggiensis]TKC19465.1 GntR family transcriptional regulator [Robertmurraya kyonggiensis]